MNTGSGVLAVDQRNPSQRDLDAEGAEAASGLDEFSDFLDIPIRVGVQLGVARLALRSALALQPSMVVKLDRSAGEKVDLLLDGRLIGAGEIVVIEEMMGLRITDLDLQSARRRR